MPPRPAVPLTCVTCAAPFSLTPHAYQRRRARYGTQLLCPRCLADGWLRSPHGRTAQEDILRDDPFPSDTFDRTPIPSRVRPPKPERRLPHPGHASAAPRITALPSVTDRGRLTAAPTRTPRHPTPTRILLHDWYTAVAATDARLERPVATCPSHPPYVATVAHASDGRRPALAMCTPRGSPCTTPQTIAASSSCGTGPAPSAPISIAATASPVSVCWPLSAQPSLPPSSSRSCSLPVIGTAPPSSRSSRAAATPVAGISSTPMALPPAISPPPNPTPSPASVRQAWSASPPICARPPLPPTATTGR